MPLCGSSFCGCALVSVPADFAEINGAFPTIDVAGNGTGASPWNLTLNDEWAGAIGKGIVAYAQITANLGTYTTELDIAGLSVVYPQVSGRRYRVVCVIHAFGTVANDNAILRIRDGGGAQRSAAQAVMSNNGSTTMRAELTALATSTATATRKGTFERIVGTGALTIAAATTQPGFIYVEDLGTS